MFNIFFCVLGTLGFCYILNAPIKKIPYILIGAFISSSVFEILYTNGIGLFSATAIASTAIGLYCEGISRIIKTPTTVILLPSTVPLLPGGSLYYATSSFIARNQTDFKRYSLETLYIGFGIAIGAIITSIIMKIVFRKSNY